VLLSVDVVKATLVLVDVSFAAGSYLTCCTLYRVKLTPSLVKDSLNEMASLDVVVESVVVVAFGCNSLCCGVCTCTCVRLKCAAAAPLSVVNNSETLESLVVVVLLSVDVTDSLVVEYVSFALTFKCEKRRRMVVPFIAVLRSLDDVDDELDVPEDSRAR